MSVDDDARTLVPGMTVAGGGQDAPTLVPLGAPSAGGQTTIDDVTRFPATPSPGTTAGTHIGRPPSASEDSGPLEAGQTFGSRYHIIRLLGVGGMGAVYHAWDAELGVSVAIKVIRPEIMADPTTGAEVERRFKRELLLARQVTHKNVVRIHDLGEITGIKYITMSFVDGIDLSTRLKQEGRLPVDAVMRIARSVVSGLVAAHTAGVVHRDLKPANIMIGADDEALIMDFGIARSSSTGGAPSTSDAAVPAKLRRHAHIPGVTMAEGIVGTVEYMAPEQAKGQPVDQRADVYAFGLILYDLLVGRSRNKNTDGPITELQGRMEHAPPPARSLVTEIPEPLDRLISRCLEPDPEKRFQTTKELEVELNRLDEHGKLIPIRRVIGLPLMTAVVLLLLALAGGAWWYARSKIPDAPHDPVTVVVADMTNSTGDPTFDHTLEQTFRRGLEGASFITAYDRTRIRSAFGVRPPDKLDEAAARELAVKQGLGVVLSGSIARQGNGYEISIRATQAVTAKEVVTAKGRASSNDQVLVAATNLVTKIRKALGDKTTDSAQLFAMRSVSTTSLEVFRHYAAAMEAQTDGKLDEARLSYQKTVDLDPNFGLGYQGLAVMSRNFGKLEDANKYTTEALKHLDGMTERERFAVRASYYMTTGDFQQCEKEYGELLAQFAADAVGHNNRAVCLSQLRNMREAAAELRQAVQILPKRLTLRANLAMTANYAGDFQAAEQEAKALESNDFATLAVAFAQVAQGLVPEATETYKKLGTMGARGASWAASGSGDLALYEGRFSDAARAFEQGVAADLAAKDPDRAARKLTSVAYVHLLRGQKAPAIAAADKALLNSKAVPIRFLAGRIFAEAGASAKAKAIAAGLSAEIPAEARAYGKIIEGEIALKSGNPSQAVQLLTAANGILDTWLGQFDLGRAYLEARVYPQADSAFDLCLRRRGEVLSLLVDEEPTYGYLPPVYYYQGLVREGLKNTRFADSYREYLKIRGPSKEDPLLPDVRRRAGG